MRPSWRWGGAEDVGEGSVPLIGGSMTVVVGPHAPVRLNPIVCHARRVLCLPGDWIYTLLGRLNRVRVLLSTSFGQHRWNGLLIRQPVM